MGDITDMELDNKDSALMGGEFDNPAYNDIGIIDKQIEPSNKISKFVTRNQSLGNLESTEFRIVEGRKDEALSLMTIPYDLGGWLGISLGLNVLQRNELSFVMSGSKQGYNRELLATRKAVITKETKGEKKVSQGISYD